MDNEEKMVEQIERIIASNDELEIMQSVNKNKVKIRSYQNRGSIENIFLGALIIITVIGGIVVGLVLAR